MGLIHVSGPHVASRARRRTGGDWVSKKRTKDEKSAPEDIKGVFPPPVLPWVLTTSPLVAPLSFFSATRPIYLTLNITLHLRELCCGRQAGRGEGCGGVVRTKKKA